MEIRTLENIPLSEIAAAFNAAFSDYFVPILATESALKQRWKAAQVNYELSLGAFHEGKLAGFIMTGVDYINGLKTAYNAGTGVIPEFRGRKVVSEIYQHALPLFKAAGIQQSTLEVITQNQKAIRAYEKVGFEITRKLHCFRGNLTYTLEDQNSDEFQISRTRNFNPEHFIPFQTFTFSWDYRNENVKLQSSHLESWYLHQKEKLMGYLLVNPANGLLLQLGFDQEILPEGSSFLFNSLAREMPAIRVNNIDSKAKNIVLALKAAGFENHLDQYEMRLKLN